MSKARTPTSVILVSLCALACTLTFASVPARAARGHVLGGSFGQPGSGEGQLSKPSGVAVDEANGDVYVVDSGNDRVEFFNGVSGVYLGQFDGSGTLSSEGTTAPTGRFAEPAAIAVDNNPLSPSHGDVYVADTGHSVIDKFTAVGAYIGQITGTPEGHFKSLFGIATDVAGEVWVENSNEDPKTCGYTRCRLYGFDNALANALDEAIEPYFDAFAQPGAFAVNSSGDFYFERFVEGTARVGELDSDGKLMNSEVAKESVPGSGTPELETPRVAVEAHSDDAYIGNVVSVGRFTSAGEPIERFAAPGMHSAGVAVDTASGSVYVADWDADVVDVFPVEPPAMPLIEGQSVVDVAGGSATLTAEVNPRSLPGEGGTSFHFEYGACATPDTCSTSAYEASVPVPAGGLPSDFEVHDLSFHVQGLRAGTVYHFRVVAANSHGVSEGESREGSEIVRTFTTQTAGAFSLPDARQWEMVSPPQKRGALVEPIGQEGLIQAAVDGGAFTFHTNQPTEADPAGYANQVQLLAVRGADGWSASGISVAHAPATGKSEGVGEDYRFFSEDLSSAVVQPAGEFIPASSSQAIAPREASEQTAFLREDFDQFGGICANSCYRPLVTGMEGYANVPANTHFGEEGLCPYVQASCGPLFVGASPNGKHVILVSNVALTGTAIPPGHQQLYEWSGGELSLVSSVGGSPPAAGAEFQGSFHSARHGVSEDGSRVFWSETFGEKHLFMTDTQTGKSVKLDAVQGGSGEGPANADFQIASADGSTMLFTDSKRLTPDAGTGTENDLYECAIVETSGEPRCELTDLTPPSGLGPAKVLTLLPGMSEDGSWIYFLANGLLSNGAVPVAGAVHGNCGQAGAPASKSCNLYVRHAGRTQLVAVISGEGMADAGSLDSMPARVSPDGHWLAFTSDRQLTGYDNRDAIGGQADQELYLYDATAAEGAGELVCASCDPTGARPTGVGGLAAKVPGWTDYRLDTALYQSRYLSDSGRLFFDSPEALMPQDVNGTWDVYEYEPAGVGDCTTGGVRFSARSNGCVGLISSGGSADESLFMDASETGGDVFFLTKAKLVSEDFDEAFDVYDAHECTSMSPCLPAAVPQSPACTTAESCRAAPAPAPGVFGAPPSATFDGLGNAAPASPAGKIVVRKKAKAPTRAQQLKTALARCRKLTGKRRATCERTARVRYARSARGHGSSTRRGGGGL